MQYLFWLAQWYMVKSILIINCPTPSHTGQYCKCFYTRFASQKSARKLVRAAINPETHRSRRRRACWRGRRRERHTAKTKRKSVCRWPPCGAEQAGARTLRHSGAVCACAFAVTFLLLTILPIIFSLENGDLIFTFRFYFSSPLRFIWTLCFVREKHSRDVDKVVVWVVHTTKGRVGAEHKLLVEKASL